MFKIGASMKFSASGSRFVAVASFAFLTACGGGADNESGSLSDFHITGGELEVTAAGCPAMPDVRSITVSGGAGPYTVVNNYPAVIEANTLPGGKVDKMIPFTVSFLGGCFELEEALTVYDSLGRRIPVPLTYKSS
jgi:hypothetical protein